jgi:hypothetical protein
MTSFKIYNRCAKRVIISPNNDGINSVNKEGDDLVKKLHIEFGNFFDISVDIQNVGQVHRIGDAYTFMIWHPPEKDEFVTEAVVRNASSLGFSIRF